MRARPVAERLWEKALADGSGCWIWQAVQNDKGYGHIGVKGRMRPAHRVAYELVKGQIPEGLQIDHLCRVRNCINPAHLEAVTQQENWRRGEAPSAKQAQWTHCKRGHEFTPENTHGWGTRKRRCRICRRMMQKRRYERQRAKVREG